MPCGTKYGTFDESAAMLHVAHCDSVYSPHLRIGHLAVALRGLTGKHLSNEHHFLSRELLVAGQSQRNKGTGGGVEPLLAELVEVRLGQRDEYNTTKDEEGWLGVILCHGHEEIVRLHDDVTFKQLHFVRGCLWSEGLRRT